MAGQAVGSGVVGRVRLRVLITAKTRKTMIASELARWMPTYWSWGSSTRFFLVMCDHPCGW